MKQGACFQLPMQVKKLAGVGSGVFGGQRPPDIYMYIGCWLSELHYNLQQRVVKKKKKATAYCIVMFTA